MTTNECESMRKEIIPVILNVLNNLHIPSVINNNNTQTHTHTHTHTHSHMHTHTHTDTPNAWFAIVSMDVCIYAQSMFVLCVHSCAWLNRVVLRIQCYQYWSLPVKWYWKGQQLFVLPCQLFSSHSRIIYASWTHVWRVWTLCIMRMVNVFCSCCMWLGKISMSLDITFFMHHLCTINTWSS